MGSLTTRPPSHGLHIHPVTNDKREFGDPDPQISTISSEGRKTLYKGSDYTRLAAVWHSDIAFEKAPADFSSLRLTQLPSTGGDTLWASGYEVYDRLSKPYRKFVEGLTAEFQGEGFKRIAQSGKFEMYTGERGSPLNVGSDLEAIHPVGSLLDTSRTWLFLTLRAPIDTYFAGRTHQPNYRMEIRFPNWYVQHPSTSSQAL